MKNVTHDEKLKFESRLKLTLDKLRIASGLNAKAFAEMFGVSSLRYHQIRCGIEQPTANELITLASSFELGINLIFSGKIGYVTLARQFRGERRMIPQKYQVEGEQLSRVRGVYTIYKSLKMGLGEGYAAQLFGGYQILPEFFENLDSFVSPQLGTDLLSEMTHRGMTPGEIRQMGAHNYFVNENSVNRQLAHHRTPKRLYEAVHAQMPEHYDRVFSYKLDKLTDYGCTVHSKPKEEPVEIFKTRKVGSREICLFKQGVSISFLPIIANGRLASVKESRCLYKGDDHCAYHLSW